MDEIKEINEDELALETMRDVWAVCKRLEGRYISAFQAITHISIMCDRFYELITIKKEVGGER
jgi:hypothetical protein